MKDFQFPAYVLSLPEIVLFPRLLVPLQIIDPQMTEIMKICENTNTLLVLTKQVSNQEFNFIASAGSVKIAKINPMTNESEVFVLGSLKIRIGQMIQNTIIPLYQVVSLEENNLDNFYHNNKKLTKQFKEILQLYSFEKSFSLDHQIKQINNIYNIEDLIAFATIRFVNSPIKRQEILEISLIKEKVESIIEVLNHQLK